MAYGFHGGVWVLSVPEDCRLDVRIGFTPGVSIGQMQDEVRAAIKRSCEGDPWLHANPPQVEFNGFHAKGWLVDKDWSAKRSSMSPLGHNALCDAASCYTTMTEDRIMGSATVQSRVWGPGVADWAQIQEPTSLPLYLAILDALALPPNSTLLDVGCGTGVFSDLASKRGLDITGLDASDPFITAARRRVTAATFTTGDLEELQFGSNSFDAVVGCNSFQYASNPTGAVREAARVLRPGGHIVIAVWGPPEQCAAANHIKAIGSLLPAPPPGTPGPFALSSAQALEALVRDAGLAAKGVQTVETPWTYPDREAALRGLMSSGPAHRARSVAGDDAVRAALDEAIAPYRRPDGSYRMENVFMFVMGRKP